ncbi:hypothetical protein Dde_1710 [Oleidesulfovibrio alaskensis G20]|uniref:Flagellar protein FlaG protein n=1 Tax=Oleidesulfovibrio alaskensis (strain ATCC BAA-1058 / DSM 17464 / G20) TaxID=207559 RepID=Q310Y9_OLEA2|nr:flagellar protein FlaG [Oleidesulfovibrio alaskensis]ABB38507.1 hypothetical protein Dde_1710 [Oleidesulfovibrio alaskensis G20]MBG0773482.1 flagellar protein FlaG [Oleidesulfovibrio alaskensis]
MKIEELSASKLMRAEDPFSRVVKEMAAEPKQRAAAPAMNEAAAGREAADTAPDVSQVQQAVKRIQERLAEKGAGFTFTVDTTGHSVNVTVTDKDSDRVLMRIPAEGVLRLAQEGDSRIGTLLNKSY